MEHAYKPTRTCLFEFTGKRDTYILSNVKHHQDFTAASLIPVYIYIYLAYQIPALALPFLLEIENFCFSNLEKVLLYNGAPDSKWFIIRIRHLNINSIFRRNVRSDAYLVQENLTVCELLIRLDLTKNYFPRQQPTQTYGPHMKHCFRGHT